MILTMQNFEITTGLRGLQCTKMGTFWMWSVLTTAIAKLCRFEEQGKATYMW